MSTRSFLFTQSLLYTLITAVSAIRLTIGSIPVAGGLIEVSWERDANEAEFVSLGLWNRITDDEDFFALVNGDRRSGKQSIPIKKAGRYVVQACPNSDSCLKPRKSTAQFTVEAAAPPPPPPPSTTSDAGVETSKSPNNPPDAPTSTTTTSTSRSRGDSQSATSNTLVAGALHSSGGLGGLTGTQTKSNSSSSPSSAATSAESPNPSGAVPGSAATGTSRSAPIIGGVVGAVIPLVLLVLTFLLCRRRRSRAQMKALSSEAFVGHPGKRPEVGPSSPSDQAVTSPITSHSPRLDSAWRTSQSTVVDIPNVVSGIGDTTYGFSKNFGLDRRDMNSDTILSSVSSRSESITGGYSSQRPPISLLEFTSLVPPTTRPWENRTLGTSIRSGFDSQEQPPDYYEATHPSSSPT